MIVVDSFNKQIISGLSAMSAIINRSDNNLKKLPISAVMVIYNEEKVLERALKSFCDVVDEIIIVHDGKCADKSLEIARKYTDKIFELEHVGEAEKHRPFTYKEAKNDWILQVDADEYLSDELRNNLDKLISRKADIYEASYSIYLHQYSFYKRILFRRNRVYFIGIPHDAVMPLDENVKIKKTNLKLMHEPLYDNYSFQVFKKKFKPWTRIHAKSLLQNFHDIPKWNCTLTELDARRRLLVKHPFFLGMIGATAFKGISYIKLFLQKRDASIIKMGINSCMYCFYLYYYVWNYKNKQS
jgi:glycosyltransferase involved in cell wall biosynthesis